ncbi:MAG: DUF2934 domain-containing protein [Paracoccaceae bacterium]|nr:DUF2934 domain-containing protein [Paracoccaceae bacterium]
MEQTETERIRQRAYAIWEDAGRPAGRADEHWQQAQADLAAQDAYGLDPQRLAALREGAGTVQDDD